MYNRGALLPRSLGPVCSIALGGSVVGFQSAVRAGSVCDSLVLYSARKQGLHNTGNRGTITKVCPIFASSWVEPRFHCCQSFSTHCGARQYSQWQLVVNFAAGNVRALEVFTGTGGQYRPNFSNKYMSTPQSICVVFSTVVGNHQNGVVLCGVIQWRTRFEAKQVTGQNGLPLIASCL